MSKNLLTGIGGFVASHLADYLLEQKEQVIGSYRWNEDLSKITHIRDKITMIPADLLDLSSLIRLIADNKPDVIYHLAAQSFVNDSFTNPIITVETNTIGTLNLLESIRLTKDYIHKDYNPIIMLCSSSEYYGKVNKDEVPITESNPPRPGNQYAIGKIGADMSGYFYSKYYGMKIITTRFFTHTGDRRTMDSAEVNFAKQIAKIEYGLQEPIVRHGNLNSVRTWANVKDAVKAYYLLSKTGSMGEVYNIGGTQTKTIGEMLSYMISLSSMKDIIITIEDPALVRNVDVNLQIVDTSKFKENCNYEFNISFEETIKSVLDFWRNKIELDYDIK